MRITVTCKKGRDKAVFSLNKLPLFMPVQGINLAVNEAMEDVEVALIEKVPYTVKGKTRYQKVVSKAKRNLLADGWEIHDIEKIYSADEEERISMHRFSLWKSFDTHGLVIS